MYKIKIHKAVPEQARNEGITSREFDCLIDTLIDIAKQANPRKDWRVDRIACTGAEWQRVKVPGETWRGIVEICDGERVIILHMILRRDADTYRHVGRVWFALPMKEAS